MREKSCVGRAEGVTVVRHSRSTKAERRSQKKEAGLHCHLGGGLAFVTVIQNV